jgi:hypothetical protein
LSLRLVDLGNRIVRTATVNLEVREGEPAAGVSGLHRHQGPRL